MAWRNKQEAGKHTDTAQRFWVNCPKCKEKIAAPKEWVFKYLDRIGYEAEPKQKG